MSSHPPRFGSPDDLNTRDREHYDVARMMRGWFTKADFAQRYGIAFPLRNKGSIIPSDYCTNRENKGNTKYPRFLEWDGGSKYRFVGLGDDGASAFSGALQKGLPPPPRPAPVTTSKPASPRHRPNAARFLPAPGRIMTLDAESVRTAILAYNRDPKVQAQERQAAGVLSNGFEAGRVASQLATLDQAYSTRSVGADLVVVAQRIEHGFDRWTSLLSAATPLTERVTDSAVLGELMAYFLDGPTRRTPRSLATKALHFAAPKCFAPADTYAANLLGGLLDAGGWSHTSDLDSRGMTTWYADYLGVIHAIGIANRSLLQQLISLDAESATGTQQERVRGLPKILDKILWWLGRPDQAGSSAQLFQ
jgi:hypothetical protein